MNNYCGENCDICGYKEKCKGCCNTSGKPFGGNCIAAEYIKTGGKEKFEKFKSQIMSEFNAFQIEGMPEITELYCLGGFLVNLAYPMPNGYALQLLDDKNVYLGTQVEHEGTDRCFGLIAGMDFLFVCEYGEGGAHPELVMYKRR